MKNRLNELKQLIAQGLDYDGSLTAEAVRLQQAIEDARQARESMHGQQLATMDNR